MPEKPDTGVQRPDRIYESMSTANDNLVKRWWRQLRFDLPRVKSHAESRKRVVIVLVSIVVVLVIVVAYLAPFLYMEYRYGGGW